jgi:tetratricopeptide (TPR) repeat protein
MSIIEETLRMLQAKRAGNTEQVSDERGPKNTRPRTRPFVMIMIVLAIMGLGTYMAIDRYQKKLNMKQDSLINELRYLETEILPEVETLEVAAATSEPEGKQQGPDTQVDDTRQESPVISVQLSQLPVSDNQVDDPFGKGLQGKEISPDKTTVVDESNQEAEIAPIVDARKVEPESDEIVLYTERRQSVDKTVDIEAAVLNQVPSRNIVSEPEQGLKHGMDKGKSPERVNQQTDTRLSSEPVEALKDSEQTPASLLLEEYEVKKQLDRARNLIRTGSYAEAIRILKTVIDRSGGTWDTYLLIGTAYLGSGELDYAEAYLNMGLAINSNIPQLWLQRAIVEQQRGNHEAALHILHETESITPDIPEVQLNIGYSHDVIGNKNLSVKAYLSFLRLTDGNPAYIIVRHKVLKRLQFLK